MSKDIETPRTKIGRPSNYNDDLAFEICAKVASGETLSAVCASPEMPSRQTVYRWLEQHPAFRVSYRRAREMQAEAWSDEIVAIADDTTLDTITKVTPQGREYEAVDHENIQRSKLRVHTRQWLMARLHPQAYGDRVEHEHSGLIGHAHVHGQLDDKEKMRRLATFLLQGGQGPDVLDALPVAQADQDGGQ
jgi:hypothetical protein